MAVLPALSGKEYVSLLRRFADLKIRDAGGVWLVLSPSGGPDAVISRIPDLPAIEEAALMDSANAVAQALGCPNHELIRFLRENG